MEHFRLGLPPMSFPLAFRVAHDLEGSHDANWAPIIVTMILSRRTFLIVLLFQSID